MLSFLDVFARSLYSFIDAYVYMIHRPITYRVLEEFSLLLGINAQVEAQQYLQKQQQQQW